VPYASEDSGPAPESIQVYQEMISLPMEKLAGCKEIQVSPRIAAKFNLRVAKINQ